MPCNKFLRTRDTLHHRQMPATPAESMIQFIAKVPFKAVGALASATILGACATAPKAGPDGVLEAVPEPVLAIAAPYQNLEKVRIGPHDNCYWYLHEGVVQDTWLPLRTNTGNLICREADGA